MVWWLCPLVRPDCSNLIHLSWSFHLLLFKSIQSFSFQIYSKSGLCGLAAWSTWGGHGGGATPFCGSAAQGTWRRYANANWREYSCMPAQISKEKIHACWQKLARRKCIKRWKKGAHNYREPAVYRWSWPLPHLKCECAVLLPPMSTWADVMGVLHRALCAVRHVYKEVRGTTVLYHLPPTASHPDSTFQVRVQPQSKVTDTDAETVSNGRWMSVCVLLCAIIRIYAYRYIHTLLKLSYNMYIIHTIHTYIISIST